MTPGSHALSAASLSTGEEDGYRALTFTIGTRLTFAAQRVQPVSAIAISILQNADIVVHHTQYTVGVASQFGV